MDVVERGLGDEGCWDAVDDFDGRPGVDTLTSFGGFSDGFDVMASSVDDDDDDDDDIDDDDVEGVEEGDGDKENLVSPISFQILFAASIPCCIICKSSDESFVVLQCGKGKKKREFRLHIEQTNSNIKDMHGERVVPLIVTDKTPPML